MGNAANANAANQSNSSTAGHQNLPEFECDPVDNCLSSVLGRRSSSQTSSSATTKSGFTTRFTTWTYSGICSSTRNSDRSPETPWDQNEVIIERYSLCIVTEQR